jgi:hypothetical protein
MCEKKPSKSLLRKPPLHVPPKGSPWTELLSPEPIVYSLIFIYICQSVQQRAFQWNEGKTYSHHPRSPTRMEGLHTMGCGLVPQGDAYSGAVTKVFK